MDHAATSRRLGSLTRPRGELRRLMTVGDWTLRIEGLDGPLARDLDSRWGGFLSSDEVASPTRTIRVLDAGDDCWLALSRRGEAYRIESLGPASDSVVLSYHFAIAGQSGPRGWRVGLSRSADEPAARTMDNVMRYAVARLALDDGGFALHAAAVLHGGRAFVLAGPSGAGKTTAVGLAAPARSIGDDFAVVVPGAEGWRVPALPFDNSERVEGRPPRGLLPVAGIWRLYKSPDDRIERPAGGLATASLLGCTAFPWAVPSEAGGMLEHVRAFVAEAHFAHLHFTRSTPLLDRLLADAGQSAD